MSCASGFRTKQALQGHYSSKLHLQQKALQETFHGPGIFREQRCVPVIVDAEQEAILPARAGLFFDSYRELPSVLANVVKFHVSLMQSIANKLKRRKKKKGGQDRAS